MFVKMKNNTNHKPQTTLCGLWLRHTLRLWFRTQTHDSFCSLSSALWQLYRSRV